MASRIRLKKPTGAKIAMGGQFILFVDIEGNPHVFSDKTVKGYRRKDEIRYKGSIGEEDVYEITVDLSEIKEKCVDTWCDNITFGFEGVSGRLYYWFTPSDYTYSQARYAFEENIEFKKKGIIKNCVILNVDWTFGRIRYSLFSDGTLHSRKADFNDNYLKDDKTDLEDEDAYDDIDIPDELLTDDVKEIYSAGEGVLVIDENDRCHWLDDPKQHRHCNFPKRLQNITNLNGYSTILIFDLSDGAVAVTDEGRLEIIADEGDIYGARLALAKYYFKDVVDIAMPAEPRGFSYSNVCVLAVNKEGKIMPWGDYLQYMQYYIKLIPKEFLID